MRRHIAGAARIVILAPRAADVVAFLQQHKRIDPRLPQRDGHGDAGKSSADYRDFIVHRFSKNESVYRLRRSRRCVTARNGNTSILTFTMTSRP